MWPLLASVLSELLNCIIPNVDLITPPPLPPVHIPCHIVTIRTNFFVCVNVCILHNPHCLTCAGYCQLNAILAEPALLIFGSQPLGENTVTAFNHWQGTKAA